MSQWEAKAAVIETINAYSGAAGRLDIEAFVNFFDADAEIHGIARLLGQPEPLKGAQQIGAIFGRSFENIEWLLQMNTTTDVIVSADGRKATASTTLIERAKRKNAGAIELTARYDDELVLTKDGWRFTKRTLTPYAFKQTD
jgi:hypothetical protein